MKITKQSLFYAVEFPSSIVKQKASNAMFSYLSIGAAKNRLSAAACDCDQYCTSEADCDGTMETVCVSCSHFKSLSPLFSEEVEISLKDGKMHIASSGKFILGTLSSDTSFATWNNVKPVKIGVDCATLKTCIERVAFASHKSSARGGIWGVHVVTCEQFILAEACNGKDLARIKTKAIAAKSDFLIPLDFVPNFCKALARDGAILILSENTIGVSFTSGEYYCKRCESAFLDVSPFAQWTRNPIGDITPSNWIPIVRTALGMSGEDANTRVDLTINNGTIASTGKNFSVSVNSSDKLDGGELKLNAVTFLRCLEAFNGENAKVSLCEENRAIVLEQGGLTVITSQLMC